MAYSDDIPTLSLDDIQSAILAAVQAQFPDFKTVEFDRDDEDENFASPACFMEMNEGEPWPAGDAGSGQWPVMLRFDARILLSARKTARADVKRAALAFATWMNLRRFPGTWADPCQVIAVEQDEFMPEVDRYRVWRVEWVMPCFLGVAVWNGDGAGGEAPPIPSTVYAGVSPDIGAAHATDYSVIVGSVQS